MLYDVIGRRSSVIEGSLTVDDLNAALDDISRNISKGQAAF